MIALLHNSGTPPYGHFVITATFFARQNGHTLPYKNPL